MLDQLNMILRWLNRNISWSQLSVFGNSPLAKLAVLAPIVAVFVRLQEDLLRQTIGFSNVTWLYWSLIAISAGQLLYIFYSYGTIKKYGRDRERYVIEAVTSWTAMRHETVQWDYYYRSFSEEAGKFHIHPRLLAATTESELLRLCDQNGWNLGQKNERERVLRGMEALVHLLETGKDEQTGKPPTMLANAIVIILQREPKLIKTNTRFFERKADHLDELLRLSNSLIHTDKQNDARILALNWEFGRLDHCYPRARLVVASLYTLGSVYFIWRAISGLLTMLGLPGYDLIVTK